MSPLLPLVAAARIVEERIRTSRRLRRLARTSIYLASRVSSEARDYVRIRVRRIV